MESWKVRQGLLTKRSGLQAKESAERARSELDLEREQNVERSSMLRTELSAAEESARRAHNDVQKAKSAVASEVANTR